MDGGGGSAQGWASAKSKTCSTNNSGNKPDNSVTRNPLPAVGLTMVLLPLIASVGPAVLEEQRTVVVVVRERVREEQQQGPHRDPRLSRGSPIEVRRGNEGGAWVVPLALIRNRLSRNSK